MNTEEYLPPENEQTAITVHESGEVAAKEKFIRIQCDFCSTEIGFTGKQEHAWSLLEKTGWKVGAKIICPECVKKEARKFFNRHRE